MDFESSSSLFTLDIAYENEFDFSNLITPTFVSFQEPNPIINCGGIENDVKQNISETTKSCENTKGEPKNNRAKHRDNERQRRQEVKYLFKNLRYILPSRYIKGKRSSSDHVQEAINYIKDLQKNIKEVSDKRDRIKRSITSPSSTSMRSLASSSSSLSSPLPSSSSQPSNCSCVGDKHIDVVVRPCLVGIEIVANGCFRHESCLSSVLQLLDQEQCLNVLSCISTKMHHRFIHTIVSEVEEGLEVNFSELREKIMKMGTPYI